MNSILFITVLVVSFVVVRIGAIAFQLTGLEWSIAKFQALSCFTSTGFTTRESELIIATRQRRGIASTLIVLGHAGLVTMIATFANSLRTPAIQVPLLPKFISPGYFPWINLAVIVVVIYAAYKILTRTKLLRKITHYLRKRVIRTELIERVSFEELTVATGGYGICKIDVLRDSPLLDKTLMESELRRHDITVLAIESQDTTIPNPSADTKILLADKLICFGKLENIRNRISASAK